MGNNGFQQEMAGLQEEPVSHTQSWKSERGLWVWFVIKGMVSVNFKQSDIGPLELSSLSHLSLFLS